MKDKVEPPWIPVLKDKKDCRHFDVLDNLVNESLLSKEDNDLFNEF